MCAVTDRGRAIHDAGYSLVEVLAAGAIAATMITTAMVGLVGNLRATHMAATARQSSLEGRNIAARLRAGIPPSDIAEAYPDWSIRIEPYERPVDPATAAVMTRAVIAHAGPPPLRLEIIYLEDGPVPVESDLP